MPLSVNFRFLKKRAAGLISSVIVILLILQASTTFKLFGFCLPEDLFPSVASYRTFRTFCSPSLWPIIEYALYTIPHYEGEKLDHPVVFGILEDFTEVQIFPADLGLRFNRWSYREGLVYALQQATDEDIRNYVESYRRRRLKKLIALRLENHPLFLVKTGVKAGEAEILKIIHVNSLVEKM